MIRILLLRVSAVNLTYRALQHLLLSHYIALSIEGLFLLRLSNMPVTFVHVNNRGRSILLFFPSMCCVCIMLLGHLHLGT